jgi:outer membrane biosynthesis protein TonB
MAQQESGTNWIVVGAGALFLALAVLAFNDPLLRALAAVVVFVAAFVMARPRDDSTIENPLLEKLRTHKDGLDRRKYGRLRSTTERLLDNVRQMNKIAIDGREGRLSPRHAHAELDRLAAVMRDVIDEIRKAAGVPTPAEEPASRSGRAAQPSVVLPKATREAEEAEGATATEVEPDEEDEDDDTDKMLDELEAQAEAEAEAALTNDEEDEEEPEEDEEESEEDEEEPEEDEEEPEESRSKS